ncbi:neutrophil cytosol factor 2 [Aspergillus awamori]|uniref:PB1 domain-containing protein n=2 Tax=Aspergillus TaxID=5052 RepID=A0A3F3Q5N4_9EURO|nr:hypothetical protein BDQ94DRAFT_18751 [Aspergillus welwitschiae]GCB25028.1 neutrophil cytosol factor 2 [Aspergillus awamori]GKZ61243.1 hypothetical protein AnigIFM49718_007953 [Aspergillus niger]RDH34357.1 hypothetical protein BDQ94DRAFT_18751 [Aspergillus welwitschiae]GKZ72024.1 hypothetical protein AnigIFM50267_008076 [Aspergillus niger]GKZ75581.1 hypothetical protein AnigIFM56816_000238 [Aspergillus niger]
MSLKQEIETWVQALDHYDNQEYDEALRVFGAIAETSKILFNCGVIYATLGEHERAVDCYQRAVGLDQYLAIAYFQEGVSNFLLGDFEEALANFNDTLLYLRGNTSIDYEQLGLKFRLFSCEVLFNRGLCYIYLQQMGPGMQDLQYASKEKVTPDHDVIDDAIREQAAGYTVFSIPVGVVYRPNEAKVKNLKAKDYLGKSRLIAASERSSMPSAASDDLKRTMSMLDHRKPETLPFATSHLVHKNLQSRSRQQSEPPLNRNLFPPTPPPDADKASTNSSTGSLAMNSRPGSIRAARPPRLDLERPANTAGHSTETLVDKPRIGTTRTASESRAGPGRPGPGPGPRGPGESHGHRRGMSDTGFAPTVSPEETYSGTRSMPAGASWRRQQERYIDEQEEYASDAYEDHGPDGEFEIMGTRPQASPNRGSRRGTSRRPEVRKFRVKAHSREDTRYIMMEPTIEFREFESRIRDKFGFRTLLRIRMQDDGDMITMVDQEDLDLLMAGSREMARREGSEMGKMEIWVEERGVI